MGLTRCNAWSFMQEKDALSLQRPWGFLSRRKNGFMMNSLHFFVSFLLGPKACVCERKDLESGMWCDFRDWAHSHFTSGSHPPTGLNQATVSTTQEHTNTAPLPTKLAVTASLSLARQCSQHFTRTDSFLHQNHAEGLLLFTFSRWREPRHKDNM